MYVFISGIIIIYYSVALLLFLENTSGFVGSSFWDRIGSLLLIEELLMDLFSVYS